MKFSVSRLTPILGIILFSAAIWVLHRELSTIHVSEIRTYFHRMPGRRIALAIVLTVLNYGVLTAYDFLAFSYIGQRLHFSKIMLTSFIGYVFSNNIGFAALGATAVRFRLYSAWGLSAFQIANVVAFCIVTFWIGLFAIGGFVFVFYPIRLSELFPAALATTRVLGFTFLGIVAAYFLLHSIMKRPIRIRDWDFQLPSIRLMLLQVLIPSVDWLIAAGVFYIILGSGEVSYNNILSIFILAQTVALISHVPGGLGVFEGLVLWQLKSTLPIPAIMGSLIAYRAIYYLLPLAAGSLLLAFYEISVRTSALKRVMGSVGRWLPQLAPRLLAIITFVGGMVLLFSGATPGRDIRMRWLDEFLPLPIMEMSHFMGSLVGAALLVLAHGVQRRLNGAYYATLALLSGGVIVSLFKGFDYEEALILGSMALLLKSCRHYFYRRGSLLTKFFTTQWTIAILAVILCSVWVGFFSFKHVEYSSDLWWHFGLYGHASRFLRGTVGIGILLLLLAIAQLLAPSPPKPSGPKSGEELDLLKAIAARCANTNANLALLRDKAILWNQKKDAYIMYGGVGRSWITLNDPIGPKTAWRDLIWQFRDLCDYYEQWPVFYQVAPSCLPFYLDLGLTAVKIGEEAHVLLATFTLEGGAGKPFRHVIRKVEEEGCEFEIITPPFETGLLKALRRVSDRWLFEKRTREKGFSLGFFDEAYLQNFSIVVVRRLPQREIVAFANIWNGGNQEVSVDLMRYHSEAPRDVMEYLFLKIMVWGKERGCERFNLGMAPLSGLDNRPGATLWHRLGGLIFRHGENFYNFQGLRRYKEKFHPVWEPRYLACPGGLTLPRILTNIAVLISGGLSGVVRK